MIPDYDVVVIDEAHELVARVTQAATDELSAADVERAARRSPAHVEGTPADDLAGRRRGAARRDRRARARPVRPVPEELADALVLVRDAARACLAAYPKEKESEADAGRTQARAVGLRRCSRPPSGWPPGSSPTCSGCNEGDRADPPRLCVAPLQVWGPMRDKLLTDKTVVFTSRP
jgi:ATP-dependent DNA helicase DinG